MNSSAACKAYASFVQLFCNAYPAKTKQVQLVEAQELWNKVKNNDREHKVEVDRLKSLAERKKANLVSMWGKACSSEGKNSSIQSDKHDDVKVRGVECVSRVVEVSSDVKVCGEESSCASDASDTKNDEKPESRETPAQNKLKSEIGAMREKIVKYQRLKDNDLLDKEDCKKLTKLMQDVGKAENKLKRAVSEADRQRKRRFELKNELSRMAEENPGSSKIAKFARGKMGRPALEEDQPELLSAIKQIASVNSSADDRRRSEAINSCTTLDALTETLHDQGFNLSRAAAYLRLIPRRANTEHGKRHVSTVPVKLARPQNTLRKFHEDADFCFATVSYAKDVCSLLGPKSAITSALTTKRVSRWASRLRGNRLRF